MDPNATLGALRAHIAALHALSAQAEEDCYTDTGELWMRAESIATLAESLDEWMSSGGFKPNSWSKES